MPDPSIADHTVDRESLSVLESPNKLKLGLFAANAAGGVSGMTMADGPLVVGQWSEIRDIAKLTEKVGWEALIPIARWKGFGDPRPEGSGFWSRTMDTMTWAAALFEATERITIFSTCHVLLIHPLYAAKMGATLDHISGGRWGLNVVAGWVGPEFTMFGVDLPDHSKRYRYADEWMTIVERLWSEGEHFDHEGEFFRIVDGESLPKPVQSPMPLVMNAGTSGPGIEFATKHAELIFTNPQGSSEETRAIVENIRSATPEGKKVATWGLVYVLTGDSEKEVEEYVRYYSQEKGDLTAALRYADAMTGTEASSVSALADRHPKELIDLLLKSGGSLPLIGTDQQVVEQLAQLSADGLDGLAISYLDMDAGLRRYEDKLLPLMREAGLRA